MAKGMLEEMDPVYRKKQTSRFTQLGISSFNPRSLLERIQKKKHPHFRMERLPDTCLQSTAHSHGCSLRLLNANAVYHSLLYSLFSPRSKAEGTGERESSCLLYTMALDICLWQC